MKIYGKTLPYPYGIRGKLIRGCSAADDVGIYEGATGVLVRYSNFMVLGIPFESDS